MGIPEIVFWSSALSLLAVYIGYPAVMGVIGSRPLREAAPGTAPVEDPTVTIVIAACNEESVIARKLISCLDQSYPAELLDIVVVSDGSTDATVARARSAGMARTRVIELEGNTGKAAALNAAMRRVTASIVVFTDARQSLAPDAVRRLVARFADSRVGGVSGDLRYDREDQAGMRRALHDYWDYEKRIRLGEARVHSCVGATGALHSIRRKLWRDLPDGTLLDDVYTPMQIVLAGHRVLFEPGAWARDLASEGDDTEYRRRVRTLTGNYQLLIDLPGILNPFRNPIWLQYLFHKLGRLFSPMFLAGTLVGALFSHGWAYKAAFWLQLAFWLFAVGIFASKSRVRFFAPIALPYAFAVTQGAALRAFVHFLRRDWNVWGNR